jgi:SAM-dependent methyltransferase
VRKPLYRQMRELEDRHWWFLGRRQIVQSILAKLELDAGASILDVGCGTGGNLAMLGQFGEVIGVEYDKEAASFAAERKVARIEQGALPDQMPFDPEQFQLVTLLDVLEHIDEDQESLNALIRLISPGGHLVLTVPAFPVLWGTHDVEHHHKRRYRASQLEDQLKASGFQVQWLSYYNSWMFPVMVLLRMVRKILPARGVGGELMLPPAPVNKLLTKLFASERYWLGRIKVPFGGSLIGVARKP